MPKLKATADTARYLAALDAIPCAQLNYDEWTRVGMACKSAGLPCGTWDEWSRSDAGRYHEGECERKWSGFNDGSVGAGTLIYMARVYGWDEGTSSKGYDWADAVQVQDEPATHDKGQDAPALDLAQLDYADDIGTYPDMAQQFTPCEMLREYLRYLFLPGENVCVGTTTHDVEHLTLEEAIAGADELLDRGMAFVCVNPTNGRGRKNSDVTAYRHTLIESDTLPKAQQLDLMRRLRLPCAAIVDSGNKSIHAVVKVDANGLDQYRRRVAFLQAVCKANGLEVDTACKNPARLTRLAGAMRGENLQRLIDVATGPFLADEWDEWRKWVTNDAPRLTTPTGAAAGDSDTSETQAPKGNTQAALVEFMRTTPALRCKFGTNALDFGVYVCDSLPWDEGGERRRWTDADSEHLWCYAQQLTKTKSRRDVAGAFTIVAAENRFNPIADMLDELPAWDGKPRADYLLWVLFGCEDTPYTRAISHTFMRGAVLRAFEPGCKFDTVLTLIGPQGCGKSYGTRRMAMRDEYLCESVTDLTDHKLTAEQTMGKWICELAELEGMTGRRLTGVKQAITMQSVTVRLAYAHNPVDLPRSCVFVATTNESSFLADRTGNRRFWPIRCAMDMERNGWVQAGERTVQAFVALAWAEVVNEYRCALKTAADADEFHQLYPTRLTPEVERAADAMRDAASVEDTRVGVIAEWLQYAREREGINRVCARMVAERALHVDMTRQRGHQLTTEVAYVLDQCPDWHAVGKQRVKDYGTCRAWDYRPAQ